MNDQPNRELLNDGQRERLCQLIRSIRRGSNDLPEWDMPGIVAAVVKLEQAATSAEEAIATAATAAAMADYRTPALMARPGRHWPPQGDDRKRGQPMRAAARTPCPDHSDEVMPCRACAAITKPAPPGWRDMYRAEVERARNNPHIYDEGDEDDARPAGDDTVPAQVDG